MYRFKQPFSKEKDSNTMKGMLITAHTPALLSIFIGVLVAFLGLGPSSIFAFSMEQSQSIESEFKSECTGSCEMKVTSSSSVSQYQSFNSESWSSHTRQVRDTSRAKRITQDSHATVRWDQRGGTCRIRYTEAISTSYKYYTSAACDEGEVVIGGLKPGRSYRAQVKKDDGSWSTTRRDMAW